MAQEQWHISASAQPAEQVQVHRARGLLPSSKLRALRALVLPDWSPRELDRLRRNLKLLD